TCHRDIAGLRPQAQSSDETRRAGGRHQSTETPTGSDPDRNSPQYETPRTSWHKPSNDEDAMAEQATADDSTLQAWLQSERHGYGIAEGGAGDEASRLPRMKIEGEASPVRHRRPDDGAVSKQGNLQR